jgi:hypothetical protein
MTESEPPVDWAKIGAQRRANLPAMRERALVDARDTLIKIARLPVDDKGTAFLTAVSFNREELVAIQDLLVGWAQRNDELLKEALHGG